MYDVPLFCLNVLRGAPVSEGYAVKGWGGGATVKINLHGVLADVLPPDIVDSAGALAVHALGLVGADDDVGERRAVLEDEDGVGLASLLLLLAHLGCRRRRCQPRWRLSLMKEWGKEGSRGATHETGRTSSCPRRTPALP